MGHCEGLGAGQGRALPFPCGDGWAETPDDACRWRPGWPRGHGGDGDGGGTRGPQRPRKQGSSDFPLPRERLGSEVRESLLTLTLWAGGGDLHGIHLQPQPRHLQLCHLGPSASSADWRRLSPGRTGAALARSQALRKHADAVVLVFPSHMEGFLFL